MCKGGDRGFFSLTGNPHVIIWKCFLKTPCQGQRGRFSVAAGSEFAPRLQEEDRASLSERGNSSHAVQEGRKEGLTETGEVHAAPVMASHCHSLPSSSPFFRYQNPERVIFLRGKTLQWLPLLSESECVTMASQGPHHLPTGYCPDLTSRQPPSLTTNHPALSVFSNFISHTSCLELQCLLFALPGPLFTQIIYISFYHFSHQVSLQMFI